MPVGAGVGKMKNQQKGKKMKKVTQNKRMTQNKNVKQVLYQLNPVKQKRNRFRLPDGNFAKEKGWVDSLSSYENEAHKLTRCLEINRQLAGSNYRWFVTINFEIYMTPVEIQLSWKRATDNLRRRGLVAIWIREFTKKSTVHYHLLVRSQHTQEDLTSLIESALPNRKKTPWHFHLDSVKLPPKNQPDRLLHYITKARLAVKVKAGATPIPDRYGSERRLQQPGIPLRKYGTIGKFWLTKKSEIWADIVSTERRIDLGLKQPFVAGLADYVYRTFVEPDESTTHFSIEKLRRKFGYHADSPWIQQWIQEVLCRDASALLNG